MPADWMARWSRTAGALGIAADQRECDAVLARYAEPQRWYHTLRHLDECFDRLERVRSTVERPGELDLALWYHDAVYDPLANDNEARSADLAVGAMERARLTEAARDRVRALIMATRHDAIAAPGAAALLADVDLGIFAADPARFDEYEDEIRAEYSWLPGPIYRSKRRALLLKFAARARIYGSRAFDSDERRARENLARSIARLG